MISVAKPVIRLLIKRLFGSKLSNKAFASRRGESVLLSIIDDKRKLLPALLVLYICMWEFSLHVVFPIESQLGWAISEHASILFLPAGVIFLSFYLLRWWFIPVVLIGRTFVNVDFYDVGFSWTFILESIFVCLVYPLWLYLLNSANWDVFGDEDHTSLTLIGAMIFQTMVTITISLGSTLQNITTGGLSWNESTQYIVHFIVGDVLGTGVVIFLFYKVMQFAVAKSAPA
jgi:hypothetical protein